MEDGSVFVSKLIRFLLKHNLMGAIGLVVEMNNQQRQKEATSSFK